MNTRDFHETVGFNFLDNYGKLLKKCMYQMVKKDTEHIRVYYIEKQQNILYFGVKHK